MKAKTKKASTDVRSKLAQLRTEMNGALIERQAEVDGMLVALLAREHLLLLGPPGTAKTMMVKLAAGVIAGATYFYWLMSRFTVPEELFGSFSLKALKEDKHQRLTTDKLPEASIAFLDEVFKANSAILNSLLTLINERQFHNGGQAVDAPLETMVGASNELPESGELDALYDRFLLRYWTGYIADRGSMKALLMGGDAELTVQLTLDELHEAQAGVDGVVMGEEIVDLLIEVKAALEKDGFTSSDRRWVKCLRLLQAHAYLNGRGEVSEDDLLLLQHILWKEPKDRGALGRTIARIANPLAHAAQEILDAARELFRSLPIGNDVPDSQAAEVFTQIVDANGQFKSQIAKLQKLANGKASASVTEAVEAIESMSVAASRFAAKVSGLSLS